MKRDETSGKREKWRREGHKTHKRPKSETRWKGLEGVGVEARVPQHAVGVC